MYPSFICYAAMSGVIFSSSLVPGATISHCKASSNIFESNTRRRVERWEIEFFYDSASTEWEYGCILVSLDIIMHEIFSGAAGNRAQPRSARCQGEREQRVQNLVSNRPYEKTKIKTCPKICLECRHVFIDKSGKRPSMSYSVKLLCKPLKIFPFAFVKVCKCFG